jgi:hypothetical protein
MLKLNASNPIIQSLGDLFDALPSGARAEITSPSGRRRRRLHKRNALIRNVAGDYYAHLPSDFARALEHDMRLFRDAGYKCDPKFDTAPQAKLRAILDMNGGKCLGVKMLKTIVGG